MVALRAVAAQAVAAADVVEQQAVCHAPRGVLGIGQRVEVDQRRADGRSDVRRAGVAGDEQACAADQRTQFPQSELADQGMRRAAPAVGERAQRLHIVAVAGEDDLVLELPVQHADQDQPVADGIAARGGARPRMQHQVGRCRIDRPFLKHGTDARGIRRGDGEGKRGVGGRAADIGDQVELALHFVAGRPFALALRHPVGEQLVRVLAAGGKPQGNARQLAQHRGGQGALRVRRKHDGGIEALGSELRGAFLQRLRAHGVVVLHPGGTKTDRSVELGNVRRRRRARRGAEQGQMAARQGLAQGPDRRRAHEHVAERIEPDAQDAPCGLSGP